MDSLEIRVSLRPLRASGGPNHEVVCRAVRIFADGRLFAVEEDGGLKLLAWRSWVHKEGDSWHDAAGSELKRPLIFAEPEAALLHFEGREYQDGKKGPWTLTGYEHVDVLNLRRERDRSSTPNFCVTAGVREGPGPRVYAHRGWIKRTTDIGVPFIDLAPAGFSREALLLKAAGPRERLSALAV